MTTIQGTVTNANIDFLYFVLDNQILVNIALLFDKKIIEKFPKIGSKLEIESTHYHFCNTSIYCRFQKNFVLCPNDSIAGDFTENITDISYRLLSKIQEYKLEALDLLILQKNYDTIKQIMGTDTEPALLKFIDFLALRSSNIDSSEKNCSKQCLPDITIRKLSELKYIDSNSEKYSAFDYWTFGVHPSNKNEFLIGKIIIDVKCGITLFSSEGETYRAIIANVEHFNLEKYINKFVAISNFTFFTELYNSKAFYSIQYILFDLKYVGVIGDCGNYDCSLIDTVTKEDMQKYPNFIEFVMKSKSMPMVNINSSVLIWIEIEIIKSSQNWGENIFVCLDQAYTELYPLLKIGQSYILCHNKLLRKTYDKEIASYFPKHPQYFLNNGNGKFVHSRKTNTITVDSILSVQEAKQLLSSNNLVTFKGKIYLKKFKDPLGSRTKCYIPGSNIFNTPGEKTHSIHFLVGDKLLTVYLNNFENLLRPIGLVPEMGVIVRNVVPQSGSYFKSTQLTSFEILGYNPTSFYQSASLYDSHDWGEPCYLGLVNIPINTVIWAKIFNIVGLEITKSTECVGCHNLIHQNGICPYCKKNNVQSKITAILSISDFFGAAEIYAKNQLAERLIKYVVPHYNFETFLHNESLNTSEILIEEVLSDEEDVDSGSNQLRGLVDLKVLCRKYDVKEEVPKYVLLDVQRFNKY